MEKTIAFLGEFKLKEFFGLNQFHYTLSNLKPKTWEKKFAEVKNRILANELDGLILYLPTPLLMQITEKEYQKIWQNFLSYFTKTRLLVVIYERNLYGNFDYYDYSKNKYYNLKQLERIIDEIKNEQEFYRGGNYNDQEYISYLESCKYLNDPEIQDLDFYLEKLEFAKYRIIDYNSRKDDFDLFFESLEKENIELITFKNKDEVIISIKTFVTNIINDIAFSIYVSKKHFLEFEFEQFLQIFERYLIKIETVDLYIDKQSTTNGVVYNFKTNDKNFDPKKLQMAINRFDEFMELCMNSPDKAIEILSHDISDSSKVIDIINDLSKKYKRLMTDIKHQKEKIQLLMKQDLENTLLDYEFNHSSNLFVGKISGDFVKNNNQDRITSYTNRYSEEEKKILELVNQTGDISKIIIITSEIDQIKDPNLPYEQRMSSAQKIKSFLNKLGRKAIGKIEDLSIKLLIEYIDKKTGL